MENQEKIKNLSCIRGIEEKNAKLLIEAKIFSINDLKKYLEKHSNDELVKKLKSIKEKNNYKSSPGPDTIEKWRKSIKEEEYLYTIAKDRYNDLRNRSFMQIYYFFLYSKLNKYNWRFKEDKEIQEEVYRLSLKEDFKKDFFKFTTRFNTEEVFRLELLEKFQNDYKKMQYVKLRNWYIGKMDEIRYPKNYKEKFIEVFKEQISFEEFKKIFHKDNEKDKRKCHYCGISEAQIEMLANNSKIKTKRFYSRGKTMEIDQKKPEDGYNKDNIVLACYWCNNAKSDEFDPEEFQLIANGIKKVWNERLKSKN